MSLTQLWFFPQPCYCLNFASMLLPLNTLLVHSASPHLAKHVKPCWLSCSVACRHCGTLCSPKIQNPGKSFTTKACRLGNATQRGMWMRSFSQLVVDADLMYSVYAQPRWMKLNTKESWLFWYEERFKPQTWLSLTNYFRQDLFFHTVSAG